MGLDVGEDKRGKNVSNKIPEIDLNLVRDHISSFRTLESHYSRASSTKQYLSEEFSQQKMYDLYKEKMKEEHPTSTPVKISKYKDIFCTEFNIAIHQPKKDQCKYCAQYNNLSPEDKEKMKESHNEHLTRRDEARNEKIKDKQYASEDKSFKSFTFDLQSVLSYLWHETSGNRGSDEIGSILFMFLKHSRQMLRFLFFRIHTLARTGIAMWLQL